MAVRVSVACFILCHIICYSIMDCSRNNNKKSVANKIHLLGMTNCVIVFMSGVGCCLKTPLVQMSVSRGVHSSVYPWIRRRSNRHCVSCRVMVATSFSWVYCCLHFGCGYPSNAAVKKGKL